MSLSYIHALSTLHIVLTCAFVDAIAYSDKSFF